MTINLGDLVDYLHPDGREDCSVVTDVQEIQGHPTMFGIDSWPRKVWVGESAILTRR